MSSEDLHIRLLGSVRGFARRRDRLRSGGQKQRAVLAILALNAGRVVPIDSSSICLWGEQPPKTAVTSLQNFISQLRKTVGADVVVTKAPGYLLNVRRSQVDSNQFEQPRPRGALARGRPPRPASWTSAFGLWRGPPLADFTFEPFAETEIARLEEIRLTALEDRIEADLDAGAAAELVGELEALVKQNPLRERLRGQLMLALYRSGRQAEALQAYQEARRVLVDELGIEPRPALQELHASILRQESALQPQAVPSCGEDQSRRGRPRASLWSARPRAGAGPVRQGRPGPREPACRIVRLPGRAPRRPDAGLAVRGGHPGRRAALRPVARALRRGHRARPSRALPRRPTRARPRSWASSIS